jgi:hypothetical protein
MNLIKNGSFEKAASGSSPPTGNGESLPDGSEAIAGWTVFGGLASDGVAWLANGDSYGVSTRYGSDFLDLTGYHDAKPYFGVEQTIKTVVGQTYDLTFHLGVDNGSSLYSGPISVTAAAGATSKDFTFGPQGAGNVWKAFTLAFTATSTRTLISIQGLSGDQYIGLDAVSVVAAPGPAPASTPVAFSSAMAGMASPAGAAGRLIETQASPPAAFARPHTQAV